MSTGTCGASLMLFISQFLGHDAMWRALGVLDAATFSHFIEESVELFGYALMMAWAAPYACRILCAKCRNMV